MLAFSSLKNKKLPLYFQQPGDNMLQALHGHPGNTNLPVLCWPSAGDCKEKKLILQGHFKVRVPWVLIYVKFTTFASVPCSCYIWLTDNDTIVLKNVISLSFVHYLCWCILRWVSFLKSASVWKCLFRLTEEKSNIWISNLYLQTLHQYFFNCSKTAHVNEVTKQPPNCFCYYTYNSIT